MASGSLTASFTLKLNDLLSPGLVKLMAEVKQLGALMKSLAFSGLKEGADMLRNAAGEAGGLTRGIDKVGRSAKDAAGTVRDLGSSAGGDLKRITQEANAASRALASIKPPGNASLPGGRGGRGGIPLFPNGYGGEFAEPVPRGGRFDRVRRDLHAMHNNLGAVEAVTAGIAVIEPIRRYAEADTEARQIPIIAGMQGAEAAAETKRLTDMFNRESRETGLSFHSLAETYAYLRRAPGMSAGLVDEALGAHGRVAVAYHVDPNALGQGVYAAMHTFGMEGKEGLERGLATIAIGANAGHFTIDDASRALPGIGAAMAQQRVTGQVGLARAMALLQTLRLGSPDSGTAVTELQEMMRYPFQGVAQQAFANRGKHLPPAILRLVSRNLPHGASGVDLSGVLLNAEKQGIDPFYAMLSKLQEMTKGLSPVESQLVLGHLLHNDTARKGFVTLLQNLDSYVKLNAELQKVDPARLERDHKAAMGGAGQAPQIAEANAAQLDRRAGLGFLPVMTSLNTHMAELNEWIEKTDAKSPGLIDKVLLVTASFLGLITVLGTLGFVAGPVANGFMLLIRPIALLASGLSTAITWLASLGAVVGGVVLGVVVALGLAVWDIIANWSIFEPFFSELWDGIKDSFLGFYEFLAGLFTGNMQRARDGLAQMWRGFTEQLGGLWDSAKQLFLDAVGVLDSWTGGGILSTLHSIAEAAHAVVAAIRGVADVKPAGTINQDGTVSTGAPKGWPAGMFTDPDGGGIGTALGPRPSSPTEVRVQIGLADGLVQKGATEQSGSTTVHLQPIDRGPTTNRP